MLIMMAKGAEMDLFAEDSAIMIQENMLNGRVPVFHFVFEQYGFNGVEQRTQVIRFCLAQLLRACKQFQQSLKSFSGTEAFLKATNSEVGKNDWPGQSDFRPDNLGIHLEYR